MNQIKKEIREAALAYAKLGWSVIPLYCPQEKSCSCGNTSCSAIGKHPKIKDWTNNASADEVQINSWFEMEGPISNLGIVTGPKSGLYCLDVDERHDGFASLARLVEQNGALPDTLTTCTGGGGKHYFFSHVGTPLSNKVGLLPGLDFRGDGGMVVAAPSLHKSGQRYFWEAGRMPGASQLAALPDWLLQTVTKKNTSTQQEKGNTWNAGTRNQNLFQFGCSLRGRGHSDGDLLQELHKANQKFCAPPLEDEEVQQIAKSCCTYPPGTQYSGVGKQYRISNGCIGTFSTNANGDEIFHPLCNFVARIVTEELQDDGVDTKIVYEIEGHLCTGVVLPRVAVPADRFAGMSWISSAWGATAIINAGLPVRDQLRAAIQELSCNVTRKNVYTHVGWRVIDNAWCYLHASGAVDKDGLRSDILVHPGGGKLTDFELVEPPTAEKLKHCIMSSLRILDLARLSISVPLLSSAYSAVLGETYKSDFAVFLVGPSGIFKTEVAALIQAHFGKRFTSRNLPGSFTSTVNSNELRAFLTKNAILTVDDFVPGVSSERDAERLLRSQGNKSARDRMKPDGTLRTSNHPRGIILATGEELPRVPSVRARLAMLELAPGDVRLDVLTELQRDATVGTFVGAMSAFIQWVSTRIDEYKVTIPKLQEELRDSGTSDRLHRRTPDIVASLGVGLKVFLAFAQDVGAIAVDEAERIWNHGWAALVEMGEQQAPLQLSEDPVERYLELLRAAIFSGRAHLADAATNGAPINFTKWGWKNGQYGEQAQGERIGWVHKSKDVAWLQPDISFAAAQRIGNMQNSPLVLSKDTLWKRMAQRGLIQISSGEGKNLVKVTVPGGARPRLIVLLDKTLLEPIAPPAPMAPEEKNVGDPVANNIVYKVFTQVEQERDLQRLGVESDKQH